MNSAKFSLMFAALLSMLGGEMSAKVRKNIRPEDHFYRRRVVNRIDLGEKINQPIIRQQSGIYSGSQSPSNQGIIAALLAGLEAGKYFAYDPDNLEQPMNYEEVQARMQAFQQAIEPDFEEFEDEFIAPAEDEFITEDEFLMDELEFPEEGNQETVIDLAPYESVIQFIEDRIFDKNASEMVYHIDWFQVIWTDPGETLPEKYLVCFRYEDIMEVLAETQWHNRYNDAESKNLAEIFDLRLFHSYITDVSGSGVASLPEAEQRRQELLEFEHHLWSY
ncbi:MAG: hypothetical protein AAF399_00985 [Bacteroidota bacterium]